MDSALPAVACVLRESVGDCARLTKDVFLCPLFCSGAILNYVTLLTSPPTLEISAVIGPSTSSRTKVTAPISEAFGVSQVCMMTTSPTNSHRHRLHALLFLFPSTQSLVTSCTRFPAAGDLLGDGKRPVGQVSLPGRFARVRIRRHARRRAHRHCSQNVSVAPLCPLVSKRRLRPRVRVDHAPLDGAAAASDARSPVSARNRHGRADFTKGRHSNHSEQRHQQHHSH
jgi:hypothetical protein